MYKKIILVLLAGLSITSSNASPFADSVNRVIQPIGTIQDVAYTLKEAAVVGAQYCKQHPYRSAIVVFTVVAIGYLAHEINKLQTSLADHCKDALDDGDER